MTTQFARLTVDTEAVRWGATGFHNRTKEVGVIRKGQRVRVMRICPDRTLEVTDARGRGFSAKVPFDLLEDFSDKVEWSDLTDKKGLP